MADSGFLAVRDVSKTYRAKERSVCALDHISFECAQGEFVSLVGPSGCGKSTLLGVIAGLTAATEGEVVLAGQPVRAPRRDIGVMFQTPTLFPWRTALANVMLPAIVSRVDRHAARRRALELLDVVGLGEFADVKPAGLSGGMEQRVALCRLLMQNPDVMLLDEPFSALDEFTREEMNQQLLQVWSGTGKTAVLVTHNIQEAVYLADKVVVMTPRPGRVACVLGVQIPRPRTLAMTTTPEFQMIVQEVRRSLDAL